MTRGSHVGYIQSQVAEQLKVVFPTAVVEVERFVGDGLPPVDVLLTWHDSKIG